MTSRYRGARIVATIIDVACMLPWIGVVAAAGAVLYVTGVTRDVDDVLGNAIGFVTLIVPITLAAAGFDGTSRHATPGKRLLRLRIRSAGGGPGFVRALLRNTIKYAAPWELGHTAVFALVGSTTATPLWVTVVLIAAYAIPVASIVMLLVSGRALHDWVAGTEVVAVTVVQ
ncbi:MAG: RDD family protein [Pseudolysinimonas sp.]